MDKIKNELKCYELDNCAVDVISNKDSIIVAKVSSNKGNYILKYFDNDKYTYEIENYKMLESLGVKTIKVLGSTRNSMLLDDLNCSSYNFV